MNSIESNPAQDPAVLAANEAAAQELIEKFELQEISNVPVKHEEYEGTLQEALTACPHFRGMLGMMGVEMSTEIINKIRVPEENTQPLDAKKK